jgi:ElaB/YqjD/DUF883 family membrane-anchored ribosome-binding protein
MSEAPTGSTTQTLLDEFNTIVAQTERLLKGTTPTPGDGEAEVLLPSATLDENLKAARERLEQIENLMLQRSKAAFKATDTYVRAHPWHAVAIAAGIGVIIGLLLRRR